MKSHRSFAFLITVLFFTTVFFVPAPAAVAVSGTILYVRQGGMGDCSSWEDACGLQTALLYADSGDQIWVAEGIYQPDGDLPANCQEVRDADPSAGDGEYLIHNGTLPFSVTCADMAGTPREYLDLEQTGEANYSQFTAGGAAYGVSVRTVYTRIRLHPDTLKVDAGDQTFATSTGSLNYGDYSKEVTSMPYGIAADCRGYWSQTGEGNIDLRGTPFAIDPAENFFLEGNRAAGSATFEYNRQVVNFQGGGSCGWIAPEDGLFDPFNTDAGTILDLEVIIDPYWQDTFELKSGVAVYGGFPESGGTWEQRDWQAYPTILSGDLDDNDITENGVVTDVANITGNNATHVVSAHGVDATAVLDGFTITGGKAEGNWPESNGGGMYIDGGSPTLSNLVLSGNTAFYGGGLFNSGDLELTNAVFVANFANMYGAGMYNDDSSPTLMNITFKENTTFNYGGGMYNVGSSPSLTNVTFSGNLATIFGEGAGMYNHSSSPKLTNVTFIGNTARDGKGGAIYNFYLSSPEISNTIFWGNTATEGGQIFNLNVDRDGNPLPLSTPKITNSVMQGGCPADSVCTSIFIDDPLLGELADWGGTTPTIPLLPGSPAIDAADYRTCPLTDQRGVSRPQGSRCDLGAFESRGFFLSKTGGDFQSTTLATDFAEPLTVIVESAFGEPVSGGMVFFEAPSTSASTSPAASTVIIDSDGRAELYLKANGTAGTYPVTAHTPGGLSQAFFILTNTKAGTTTTIFSSLNPSTYGEDIELTATVTAGIPGLSLPTGTLQFKMDGNNLGAPVPLTNGEASLTTSIFHAGAQTITAEYSGDEVFLAGGSELALIQVVNRAETTSVVSSSANPSTYGQEVSFRAVVSSDAGVPSGGLQFRVDGENLGGLIGLVNGEASISTSVLDGGNHIITTEYMGSQDYVPSSGTLSGGQVVDPADGLVFVSASANPAVWRQSVTLTATVTGHNPSGTISFEDGDAPIEGCQDLALMDGKATCTLIPGKTGIHNIEAIYSGDANNGTCSGTVLLEVVRAATTTTITSLENPSWSAYPAEFLVEVEAAAPGRGTPTGSIVFYEVISTGEAAVLIQNAEFSSHQLVDGAASIRLTGLRAGTHALMAVYEGDDHFSKSSSAVFNQTVNQSIFRVYLPVAGR